MNPFFMFSAAGMWFNKDTVYEMISAGWIVDARGGGLVVGRSHAEGNIYMIQQLTDGRFIIKGHMEGGEYIVNADAYFTNRERLERLNEFSDEHEDMSSTFISPSSRILNTHAQPYDKMLWIDTRGQFIANKRATAKHFHEIEEINHQFNGLVACHLDSLTRKDAAS